MDVSHASSNPAGEGFDFEKEMRCLRKPKAWVPAKRNEPLSPAGSDTPLIRMQSNDLAGSDPGSGRLTSPDRCHVLTRTGSDRCQLARMTTAELPALASPPLICNLQKNLVY